MVYKHFAFNNMAQRSHREYAPVMPRQIPTGAATGPGSSRSSLSEHPAPSRESPCP